MIIKNIEIEGVGGIANNLKLLFDPQVNIICGQNGVGKTTIIETIAHFFSTNNSTNISTNILKKNVNNKIGKVGATIEDKGQEIYNSFNIDEFSAIESSFLRFSNYSDLSFASRVISLKTIRTFDYQKLNNIGRDPERDEYYNSEYIIKGTHFGDIKNWLIGRYLFSPHKDSLTEEELHNLEIAKKCFSILNPNFSFNRIIANTFDIMVNTPSGEIYYEYLSSGFKSTLSILFGIIKEIEFRKNNQKVDEFDGIILIDEVELHLHPEWQERIMGILTEVFPKVQFFVTTHSPHILQNAEANQIIPLYFDEDNQVCVRDISNYEYGFQGWTIEEILTDIMGMKTLRTELYTKKMKEFEKSVDEENYEKAKEVYNFLNKILHPNSELRKLLEIQLIRAR